MKGTHHRVVLVINGSHDAGKRIEARHHVREAHQIAFELDCAMPWLKGKGGAPHVPEVRLKEPRIKLIGDRAAAKEMLRLERQTFKRENVILA